MRVGAVILAAGLSSRLAPEFKPLARLSGQTLLERAARLFRAAGVEHILVAAGHRAEEVRAEAMRLGLPCALNPDYGQGMFTSVRAGLAGLGTMAQGLDAAFVLPVDILLVRAHTLRLVLGGAEAGPEAVLHPVFEGRRGHPPLIPAAFFPAILAWAGPGGLSGALEQLPSRDVPVADRNIHFDVDTPDDLAEARQRAERLGIPTRAEALALMELHNAGERGLGHGRGVAAAALAMGRALNARLAGDIPALDLELAESAALLHDIAKGQPRHEAAGAALLEELGFGPVARIVAAHRDIAPADAPQITERELVYLADKLVWGSRRVSVEARFRQKLDLFAHDAEACAAIRRRLLHALDMRGRVERAAGLPLDEMLAAPAP